MTLRQLAQAFGGIFRSLRAIQQGIDNMSAKIAALTAAFAVLSGSVTSALAEIQSLQQQHQADLASLAAKTDTAMTDADDAEITSLISGMQARSQTITDAVTALHQNVSQTATDTNATLSAEGPTSTVETGTTGTTGTATVDPAPVADPAPAAAATAETTTTGTAGAAVVDPAAPTT